MFRTNLVAYNRNELHTGPGKTGRGEDNYGRVRSVEQRNILIRPPNTDVMHIARR
jgi:hypothetical protein